jgi:hypothetical protein
MSRPNAPSYKKLNWPAYNKALKRRGSLTIWFDPGMVWAAKPTGKRVTVRSDRYLFHRQGSSSSTLVIL